MKYCVALANEGGGKVILGVTDKRPRAVVGSQAFPDLERTKAGLIKGRARLVGERRGARWRVEEGEWYGAVDDLLE